MIRFIVAVILISAVLYFSISIGSNRGYFVTPSFSNEIIAFLAFFTFGFYAYLFRRIAKNPQDFVTPFLLTLVLRFLLFASFMLGVILADKSGADENVLFFMIAYVLFTATEVIFLYQEVMTARARK